MADHQHSMRRAVLKGMASFPLILAAPPASTANRAETKAAAALMPHCREAMAALTEAAERDDPQFTWKLQAAICLSRAYTLAGGDSDPELSAFTAEMDAFEVWKGRTYTLCRDGWRELTRMNGVPA